MGLHLSPRTADVLIALSFDLHIAIIVVIQVIYIL